MSTATELARKTFTAAIVSDSSFGTTDLGTHESTMILYATDRPGHAYIEWDIPGIGDTEEIGLHFDVRRNLLDYDGVFSLPKQAIALLRRAGFKVGKEYE